jgi:hypothetical protein
VWECKVVQRLLRDTGMLMERGYASPQSLNGHRKKLLGSLAPPGAPAQRQAQPLTGTAANARALSW